MHSLHLCSHCLAVMGDSQVVSGRHAHLPLVALFNGPLHRLWHHRHDALAVGGPIRGVPAGRCQPVHHAHIPRVDLLPTLPLSDEILHPGILSPGLCLPPARAAVCMGNSCVCAHVQRTDAADELPPMSSGDGTVLWAADDVLRLSRAVDLERKSSFRY